MIDLQERRKMLEAATGTWKRGGAGLAAAILRENDSFVCFEGNNESDCDHIVALHNSESETLEILAEAVELLSESGIGLRPYLRDGSSRVKWFNRRDALLSKIKV